jgi:hypothetical protein
MRRLQPQRRRTEGRPVTKKPGEYEQQPDRTEQHDAGHLPPRMIEPDVMREQATDGQHQAHRGARDHFHPRHHLPRHGLHLGWCTRLGCLATPGVCGHIGPQPEHEQEDVQELQQLLCTVTPSFCAGQRCSCHCQS